MNRLLLSALFLFSFLFAQSQTGYLFVKKGANKKRTYQPYDRIAVRLQTNEVVSGMITRLMNDTIYIGSRPIARTAVTEVLLTTKPAPQFNIDAKQVLLITAGVALVTAGLTISKQAKFKTALISGTVIGVGPIAFGYLRSKISLRRKKYKIGKKFRLQMIDFYIPSKRAF